MKKATTLAAALAILLSAVCAYAQQNNSTVGNAGSGASSQTQKNIEAYLRNVYAFGPIVQLSAGPLKPTAVEGILETNIDVVIEGNKQTVKFYVSKDGKFLFRGDLSDMTKDPLAETRAQIQINDAPSVGDTNAPVTLVEYSDFECPVCKKLHDVLRGDRGSRRFRTRRCRSRRPNGERRALSCIPRSRRCSQPRDRPERQAVSACELV